MKTTWLKALVEVIWEEIESAVVAARAVAIQSPTHPALVAHQTLRCGVDLEETVRAAKAASSGAIGPYGMENHQLGDTGRAYSRELAFPRGRKGMCIPEPSRRAVADSFLTSLEAAPAPA